MPVQDGATLTGATPKPRRAATAVTATRRPQISRSSLIVLLVGLIVTAALSWFSYLVNSHNETRLLNLQTKQTGTVLQVVLPSIETPLASAEAIAATNGGDTASFRSYISAYTDTNGPFVSASLWRLTGRAPELVTTVDGPVELAEVAGRPASFVARSAKRPGLSVVGLLAGKRPRLGYAYASAGASPSYVVYAESALPAGRRITVAKGSPFSDLRFALYLGSSARPDMLLETNADHLPITGRTATVTVPFGVDALTLVATPNGQLGGSLANWRWWIIAALGCVLAIVGASTAERLVRRQRGAERLAGEVQHLLGEQRSIAEALQHALLPQSMPAIEGMEIATRYVPGVNGVDIGGDWYDVIALDERHFFFVVGDVSGRGIDAGAVMASLHFAIRGFVSEGHSPAKILDTLSGLLHLGTDHHFATVLCGVADIERHEITIANAGHLPPLLLDVDGQGEFVSTEVGPPIGVATSQAYRPVTITVPPRGTLLAYTDGLIERRGESLDAGLQRLRDSAAATHASLDGLLGAIVTELSHDDHDDDTAILGVRWLR